MAWEPVPALDAGLRAALAANKSLVYVCPPAAWGASPLLAALPPAEARPSTLILVPWSSAGDALQAACHSLPALAPVHATTGLARTQSLLGHGQVGSLIASVPDALELVRRAALKPMGLARVVIGWPELLLAAGQGPGLDTLLADASSLPRVIVTSDPAAVSDFLERHARRAPVGWGSRRPETPAGPARYAVVERARRVAAARAVLDVLDPRRAVVWDPDPDAPGRWAELVSAEGVGLTGDPAVTAEPADLVIAADLPSAEVLAVLREVARDIVVLVDAPQLPYLQTLAHPLESLRLQGAADRARDRMAQLRREVRERLTAGVPLTALLALDALFEAHDPALVAAALLERGAPPPSVAGPPGATAWVRVHVNAGRRDQLRPGDLVGALLNAVGLVKEDIGRIELREGFTLVDVRAEEAERAARGLTGTTVRGRRLLARLDR